MGNSRAVPVVVPDRLWLWAASVAAVSCSTQAPPAASVEVAVVDEALSGESAADTSGEKKRRGAPPEVRAARKAWPLANRDYAGTRATFDSKLRRGNIAQVAQAWAYDLTFPAVGYGSGTAAPLVLDGVVYYADQLSNVTALNLETGALIWEKRYDAASVGPNGIAVGWGKLFTTASDKSFVALDLATGEELWKAPIELPTYGGYSIAPIAYDGLVYLSSVPVTASSQYAGGVNGTLYALDEATGAVVWSFATVEDPGLWGHPDINSGGGAWYPPTIDETRGITYWGIGNPAPWPGTPEFPLASSRPGDNLYTNSVVSLDAKTGKLNWYYQEAPHDLFDLDFQNPPILYKTKIDGVERKLVVGSGKTGTVVALDPERGGEVVWHATVGQHENDTLTEFGAEGVVVFPGSLGGIDTPAAYAKGTVYVPVVNWGTQYFPDRLEGFVTETGTGELVALDAGTGAQRWKVDLTGALFGSVTVVNDLVIAPTFDSQVHAFDRNTGEEVWTWQSPVNINAPITVVDNTLLIPAGAG
ncbi:MAG: PQQ-binding-like beta-propeller repeat protein, partial [Polyangiales bacterium]